MPKQSQNNFVYLSNNQIQAKYHLIVAYKQILLLFIYEYINYDTFPPIFIIPNICYNN